MNLGTTTKTTLLSWLLVLTSFLSRYINTKNILVMSVLVKPPYPALIFKIINENRELHMKWDFEVDCTTTLL